MDKFIINRTNIFVDATKNNIQEARQCGLEIKHFLQAKKKTNAPKLKYTFYIGCPAGGNYVLHYTI